MFDGCCFMYYKTQHDEMNYKLQECLFWMDSTLLCRCYLKPHSIVVALQQMDSNLLQKEFCLKIHIYSSFTG